ncbi:hypothetical protein AAMO2058_001301300 [Amorphochlora amoebiformis]
MDKGRKLGRVEGKGKSEPLNDISDILGQFQNLSVTEDTKKAVTREVTKSEGKGIRTGFSWDKRCLLHEADHDHVEKPERVSALIKELHDNGLYSKLKIVKGRLADTKELVSEKGYGPHTEEHVQQIDASAKYEYGPKVYDKYDAENPKLYNDCKYLDDDTYVNQYSSTAGRVAAGCVLELTEKLLKGEITNGFAAIRPPGHHACCSQGSGFCLFNNVAVAAKFAKKKFPEKVKKILILDWDVHHGNGTQDIFDEDPSVLLISIHRYGGGFYPGSGNYTECGKGKGKGYTVNIPLDKAGMGDKEYITILNTMVIPIAKKFKPDLVFVSAGFDCAKGDKLGGMLVTPSGFSILTRMLMDTEVQPQGKIIMLLEGGYNVNSVAKSASSCIRALLGEPVPAVSSVISDSDDDILSSPLSTTFQKILLFQKFWGLKPAKRESRRRALKRP